MTEAAQLTVLTTLSPIHFDAGALMGNLQHIGVNVDQAAVGLINCASNLSLPYRIELVQVQFCDLPGYDFEKSGKTDEDNETSLEKFYEDITSQEKWYEAVVQKLDLELCPPIVAPLLSLHKTGLEGMGKVAIAMEPLPRFEGDEEYMIFVIEQEGNETFLSAEGADFNPTTDFSTTEFWLFARRC